jgi:hypothetical protein
MKATIHNYQQVNINGMECTLEAPAFVDFADPVAVHVIDEMAAKSGLKLTCVVEEAPSIVKIEDPAPPPPADDVPPPVIIEDDGPVKGDSGVEGEAPTEPTDKGEEEVPAETDTTDKE